MTRAGVVFVVPTGTCRGGAESMLIDFCRFRPKSVLPYRTIVLEPGDMAGALEAAGVQTTLLPMPRLRHLHSWPGGLRKLRNEIVARSPALVVSWMPRAHLFVAPAVLGTGIPAALWQHGHDPGWLDRVVWRLPARYEPFGMTVIEAAACGVAAVVTDRVGSLDLFEAGRNIEVVPASAQPDTWARAIEKVVETPRAREIGTAALEVARRWPWSRVARMQLAVYHSVLGAVR